MYLLGCIGAYCSVDYALGRLFRRIRSMSAVNLSDVDRFLSASRSDIEGEGEREEYRFQRIA